MATVLQVTPETAPDLMVLAQMCNMAPLKVCTAVLQPGLTHSTGSKCTLPCSAFGHSMRLSPMSTHPRTHPLVQEECIKAMYRHMKNEFWESLAFAARFGVRGMVAACVRRLAHDLEVKGERLVRYAERVSKVSSAGGDLYASVYGRGRCRDVSADVGASSLPPRNECAHKASHCMTAATRLLALRPHTQVAHEMRSSFLLEMLGAEMLSEFKQTPGPKHLAVLPQYVVAAEAHELQRLWRGLAQLYNNSEAWTMISCQVGGRGGARSVGANWACTSCSACSGGWWSCATAQRHEGHSRHERTQGMRAHPWHEGTVVNVP